MAVSESFSPFVILGLPRSRTAWLAAFLSYGGITCHHEPSTGFRDLADLATLLHTPKTGISDSGLTLLWREVIALRPDVRIVAVRRPMDEVIESGRRIGLSGGEIMIPRIERALTDAENIPGVLRVSYASLNHREVCDRIFRFCLRVNLNDAWWGKYCKNNIQADLEQTKIRIAKNLPGILRTYGAALGV